MDGSATPQLLAFGPCSGILFTFIKKQLENVQLGAFYNNVEQLLSERHRQGVFIN